MAAKLDSPMTTSAPSRAPFAIRVLIACVLVVLLAILAWVTVPRVAERWGEPSASTTLVYDGTPQTYFSSPFDMAPAEMPMRVESLVFAADDLDLARRVAQNLGLTIEQLNDYTIEAKAIRSSDDTLTGEVMITVEGPDGATAASVADALAAALIAARQEEQRAAVVRAQQIMEDKLREFSGEAKQSEDYRLLRKRLKDLRVLAETLTGDFRVVDAAVDTNSE